MHKYLADKTTRCLAGASLFCLIAGYMSVNVFRLEPYFVNIIRAASILPIFLLISTRLAHISIKKTAIIFILISIPGIANNNISINIIYIILFLYAFQSLSLNELAKLSSIALGTAILASLIFVELGITENELDVSSSFLEDNREERERSTFGYKNVNAFAALVSAYCLLIMLQGKKIVLRFFIACVVSYIFYLNTDSRTLIASTTLFILFSILFILFKRHKKTLFYSSVFLATTPLIYSTGSSVILHQMPFLDLFLSSRVSLGATYIQGLTPAEIIFGGAEATAELTIDNSIILVMGAIGFPATFYLLVKVICALRDSIKNHDVRLYAFLLSFWLLAVSESSLVRPESIICLPFWAAIIFNSRSRIQHANNTG